MDKEEVVHLDTREYYSAIERNEIMPFAATWVDLERMTVSEISQMEKDKYHEITYIWNKKGDTNEHICKTEMDSQM